MMCLKVQRFFNTKSDDFMKFEFIVFFIWLNLEAEQGIKLHWLVY